MHIERHNRLHFLILKEKFTEAVVLGSDISIVRQEHPSYRQFMVDIERISAGTSDKWHLRDYFANPTYETEQAVRHGTRYILRKHRQDIGACYVIYTGSDLDKYAGTDSAEIQAIGLFDDCTGKGYGSQLLTYVLSSEFANGRQAIYLSTREENRIQTRNWYERNSFTLIDEDTVQQKFIDPQKRDIA